MQYLIFLLWNTSTDLTNDSIHRLIHPSSDILYKYWEYLLNQSHKHNLSNILYSFYSALSYWTLTDSHSIWNMSIHTTKCNNNLFISILQDPRMDLHHHFYINQSISLHFPIMIDVLNINLKLYNICFWIYSCPNYNCNPLHNYSLEYVFCIYIW